MIRCGECKTVDVEFLKFEMYGEECIVCPECGAEESAEEVDQIAWEEEMAEDEADNLSDYLATEGDDENI